MRELFRNLLDFRTVYEETGLEEIHTPLGNAWSLWDIEYLYEKSQQLLTLRQRQAIDMCLVHNMREKDAAESMGVSPTNPVMMYATLGIRRLLDMIEEGKFERFHRENPDDYRNVRRRDAMLKLANHISSQVRVDVNNCWVFPTRTLDNIPRISIKSVYTSSGFVTINPFNIMYEVHRGSIPRDFQIVHIRAPFGFSLACVNPEHAELQITRAGKIRNRFLLDYYQRSIV